MSNAAKLKKKAAEFEQKKQFDKALQLYIQILDEGEEDDEEGDVALYNRVGDLLMRQGNVGDAMTYYEKAVDLYAESGFFNNAIALCNKILRQSPGRNSVYYKLGKISAKKGFISDAKQNFLEYASRMQTGGHLDEAFRALKEFADLCPDQDDIRLMLADQLSKKDRKGEALEQLQVLYQKFETEGRGEEMRATIDRMRAIDPAAEPKTGGGPRSQKSSDLVFIDLSDGEGHIPPPGSKRPDASKSRGDAPKRRSGESRRSAPVSAEAEPLEAAADLALPDVPGEKAENAEDEDFLPLPPLDEPEPLIEGLESSAQFVAEDPDGRDHIRGFESSALDDELSQALDAALPDVEPPLSGQQFAALRLATPLSVPTLMPPEHDLALPGELPPIGSARPMLSLTGEMELIIPDNDTPVRQPTPPRGVAVPDSVVRPAAPVRLAVSSEEVAPPVREVSNLPLIDVEADVPPLSKPAASPDSALSLVEGAELLDVPPSPPSAGAEQAPTSPAARPASAKRPLALEAIDPSAIDELAELPQWLDDPDALVGPAANGAARPPAPTRDLASAAKDETRRPPDAPLSRSPLARSVDTLRTRVESEPLNWALRRQMAEALLDSGDREAGLQVLEATMIGLERAQDLEGARSVADEIIRLMPNSVRHHQKRVEYAFRTSDRSRLPQAYLELADALFRSGQADKARAVYQRVLELSPDDARAQAALSTFGDEFLIEPLDEPDLPETPAPPPPRAKPVAAPAPVMPPPQPPPRPGRGLVRGGPPQPNRPAEPRTAPRPPQRPDAPRPDNRPDPRSAETGEAARSDPQPPKRPEPHPPRAPGRPAGRHDIKLPVRPNPAAPRIGTGKAPPPPRPAKAPPAEPEEKEAPQPPTAAARPSARPADDFINLGDWLRDDERPRSTRLVVEEEKPSGDEAADFADMLRKFKQGIAENVSDEDHDSHYDLGVAYKEMGLVDEAVAEFQKALRAPDQRVRTYEALGQCFIEKQQFQVAATLLGRALNEPGVTDDQLVGVLYLLGYASEALMRWEAAVGYYQRVFAVDIRFRDTAQRLAALERAPR
jgi:tetratricopeptide (TPR) repeat protein